MTKTISDTLREVMPNFILPNQNNFKVGKSIVDSSIILQEIIHTMKLTFIHLSVYEVECR